MTISPEARTLSTPVDVRFSTAGVPLAVRYAGKVWAVAEDPVHWFTRDSWWDTCRSVPVGVGNVVDIEHWRLQVRSNSMSRPRTFELRRQPLSEQWLLDSVSDD